MQNVKTHPPAPGGEQSPQNPPSNHETRPPRDGSGLGAVACCAPGESAEATGSNQESYPIEFENNVEFLIRKTGRSRGVIVNSLITICRHLNEGSKGGILQDALFKILSLENPKGLEDLYSMPEKNLSRRKSTRQYQDHL